MLATAIRSCQGQEGVGEAKLVAEEGARVGKQLAVVSAEDQALVGGSVPVRFRCYFIRLVTIN